MSNCKIIAISGPDRIGKATQSKMLTEILNISGYKAVRIEVPVKNFLHKHIYSMLRSGSAKTYPHFFQCLQTANRVVFQLFKLPKLLRENDYVILDRWSVSSWVYGLATGLSNRFVTTLLSLVKKPDYTIILNGPARVKETRDVYEADLDLQRRVRVYYDLYALENEDSVTLINATQSKQDVFEQIVNVLKQQGLVTNQLVSKKEENK
jgi:thymidylate kinase